ncbi:MAG TPA: CocE/NonD family hydrolase, partial [candidate division Zixibacteria bacterium]|nr:CocE/NonD family hydrolase [candidate division Zixibacteria bacterium]
MLTILFATPSLIQAQNDPDAQYIRENYTKIERQIPVRDGVRLFTSIYMPKDTSRPYPIMLQRTPYSVRPYGEDYKTRIGPSMLFAREGYIFVYQDVRGRMMSEGEFEAVRPHNPNKKSKTDIDESTDTYDTVAWLLENIPNNTGRVGVWGVSAPGFYATHTIIDAHPAIKAVSPQAPVTDWWMGDDRHHNGAFQLQATFSFLSSYGRPRPEPTSQSLGGYRDYGTPDGYLWYL